jgi:5'-phosphate synthase pdxT subunit
MRIGVLAIQGDVREHRRHLEAVGAEAPEVRTVRDLESTDGLVLPGGESTTIGLLMDEAGLLVALRERIAAGYPVYGTCAGLILLAKDVEGTPPPRVGVVDMTVARNAFGRQIASFEGWLEIPALGDGEPFHAVFIRAPRILRIGPSVTPLAYWQGEVVMAEQGSVLVSSFHPELTGDTRIHAYFADKVRRWTGSQDLRVSS